MTASLLASLLAFLPVAVVLVLVPGVTNLVVLRTAAASGSRSGAAVALGASTGIVVWSAVVALGLGTALGGSPRTLAVVKGVGAATLVASGLWSLRRRGPAREGAVRSGRGFATGLMVCLGNPRGAVTAVSVLPQFALGGAALLPSTVALGLLWAGLAGAWNLAGVWAVARGVLAGRRARRLEVGGAWALVGLGVAGVVGGLG